MIKSQIGWIGGVVLAVSSCKNLYVQKNVFVPLLKEKGELKVDASLGREAVSFNTAYAFSPKFSVMLNGFSTIDNSAQYKRKYNYQAEGALGYFKSFRDSIHFESYLGYSRGVFDSDFDRSTGELKKMDDVLFGYYFGLLSFLYLLDEKYVRVNATGTYQSGFFQNSISVLSPKSSTTFTARVQYVQFNNYKEQGTVNGQKIWYYINIPPRLLFQPVITNKMTIVKNINVVGQFGYNIPLFEGGITREMFEWNKMFFSVGFEVRLDTKKWK